MSKLSEEITVKFAKARKGYQKIKVKLGFYGPMYLISYTIRRRRYRILIDAFFTDITNFKPLRVLLAKNISALGVQLINEKELEIPLIKPLASVQKILSDLQDIIYEAGVTYYRKEEAISVIQEELDEFLPELIRFIEEGMAGKEHIIRSAFLGLLMKEGLGLTFRSIEEFKVEKTMLVYYPILIDENNRAYEIAWKLTSSEIYTYLFSSKTLFEKISECTSSSS